MPIDVFCQYRKRQYFKTRAYKRMVCLLSCVGGQTGRKLFFGHFGTLAKIRGLKIEFWRLLIVCVCALISRVFIN